MACRFEIQSKDPNGASVPGKAEGWNCEDKYLIFRGAYAHYATRMAKDMLRRHASAATRLLGHGSNSEVNPLISLTTAE